VLSVASVRSAGGAANYFAKDDYYVGEHASEVSGWGGRGAAELGLSGEVEKQVFEDLLKGKLPDGEQIGDPERRRAGHRPDLLDAQVSQCVGLCRGR
jgi:conjugative relaxase-like TrwC/TraI family protein